MNLATRPKLVLLGMMSRMPVAGVVWQTVHYLEGFRRLGYDVYYVEAHGCTPRCFYATGDEDGFAGAADFIDRIMRRFDFAGRWCYHPLYGDNRYFGLSDSQLRDLYASADLIINLHGGTEPLAEHAAGGRLVYLETDPVELQIELFDRREGSLRFLEPHCAFFSFGENLGSADCKLPTTTQFPFKPTRQPVVTDFWREQGLGLDTGLFTTIGNWKQVHRQVVFRGETYYWSKHFEFLKFVDLPALTRQRFELALSSYDEEDQRFLDSKGWKVRSGLELSEDIDQYREYIGSSRGEYTAAKDQNVRFRTGWFSDRSATYLAAGRPVITQETGFSNILPTGRGLFGFATMDGLLAGIEKINSDYPASCRAAREIALEYFDSFVVLGRFLADLGRSTAKPRPRRASAFPRSLVLAPLSRRPLKLPEATLRTVCSRAPAAEELGPPKINVDRDDSQVSDPAGAPTASIIVVTHNQLPVSRLCLESLLAHTGGAEFIVVDNGSTDGTPAYLSTLSALDPRVRVITNAHNAGFAAANNRGITAARTETLVLLNNDAIVPPGWLPRLLRYLEDQTVGAVGPVTNRIGNEAEVEISIESYGDFLDAAERFASEREGRAFEIRTLTMFCLAVRRQVFTRLGPLDEGFEIGLLEDDDYSMRLHHAGLRLLCAEDVLVYHYSQASFGSLVANGKYGELLERNKARFKAKWVIPWQPYERRQEGSYEGVVRRVRESLRENVPKARRCWWSEKVTRLLPYRGARCRRFRKTQTGHLPAGIQPTARARSSISRHCGNGAHASSPFPSLLFGGWNFTGNFGII